MTQETIDKLPLLLSPSDLIKMGFTRGMVYNTILTSKDAGVVKMGSKRMVQRDELIKWLDKQQIGADVDCGKLQTKTR